MDLSLTADEIAALRSVARKAQLVDEAQRGLAEHHNLFFQFAHLTEEQGEAFSCWRRGEHQPHTDIDDYGLAKPVGLPSELADMMAVAMIVAQRCADSLGIDPFDEWGRKHEYAISKAIVKASEHSRPIPEVLL